MRIPRTPVPDFATPEAILKRGPRNWSRQAKVAGDLYIALVTLQERYVKTGYLRSAKVPPELATPAFPAGCQVTTPECIYWAMKCKQEADDAKAKKEAKIRSAHQEQIRRNLLAQQQGGTK